MNLIRFDPTWLHQVILDGETVLTLTCPGCGTLGYLDDDQANGRVSVLCECGFHETHDFWAILTGTRDSGQPNPLKDR